MVDGRVDKKAPMQICKELFADCKWMADVQMFDAVEETEGPGHASATMGGGWIVEIASWCHDVCIIAPGLHPLRSFSFFRTLRYFDGTGVEDFVSELGGTSRIRQHLG